jgi:hypothetical protein
VAAFSAVAVIFVVLGALDVYRDVVLAARGKVASGAVLFVRYEAKSEVVEVRLDSPVDRDVALAASAGEPAAGQAIRVRYDSANPGLAEQDGSHIWRPVRAFGVAASLLFVAWFVASGRWERNGPRSVRLHGIYRPSNLDR